MIKNFSQFNESIKHLLVGPTEDEVWNSIKDLSWPDLLRKSSKSGILKGVKLAVKKGANINIDNDEPLWRAIHNDHFEVAKYLVEQGADINVDDGYPIKHACEVGDLDMVKFLLEHGANKNQSNGFNLLAACKNNDYEMVKFLLEQGVDVHLRDGIYVKLAKQKGYDDILLLLYEWT